MFASNIFFAEEGPQILIIHPVRKKNSALIRWATDIAASSRVNYGIDEGLGLSVSDDTLVIDHSVEIADLELNTQYYYQIKSIDENGNASVSEILTFSTDVTIPTMSVTTPVDGSTVRGTITISVGATDNIEISEVGFYLDGKKQETDLESPFEILWDTSKIKDGKHILFVYASDIAGNFEMKTINVTVKNLLSDTTPPTVNITSPQDGAIVYGDVTVKASVQDDQSTIRVVDFLIDNKIFGGAASVPYEAVNNTKLYTPGQHTYKVRATDKAGNIGESGTITITISEEAPQDTTPPTTTDNYQHNNAWINSDANITLTATDDISGVAHTYYTVDGVQSEGTSISVSDEGKHTVKYWSIDNVGNEENKHTIGVWIDKTPPVTTSTVTPVPNQEGWNDTLPVKVIFTSTDNLSGVKEPLEDKEINKEGITHIIYGVTDNAGNTEEEKTITIRIDTTSPEVNINTAPSILWPVNKKPVQVSINGSATDALSGIFSKVFTATDEYNEVNASLSDFGDKISLIPWRKGDDKDGRIYTIKVIITDKAGNTTSKETTATVPHDMRNKEKNKDEGKKN
jgi:hypothetical protein